MFDRQASAVQAGHAPLVLPTALGRWRRISRSLAHPLVRRAGTRVIGLLLVLVAWAAARAMIGLVAARHPATPVECLLAGVAFVGASYGSALLVLGDHMFDPVEVAPRWCRHAA
ncbi:hypothetical protein KX816_02570 [Sphingosinicellaceae bacterium]|nr:hypothetical protein KX816_02570 [Sphingosinicellaceae bacterium]